MAVALTTIDRTLLQRCLNHEPGAWNDFVDRFLGMFYHVIHYTSHLRSVTLAPEDVEDVAAEIMLQIVANDYAILRQFRGNSSLATYLTVIARRICVHELTRRTAIREAPKANGKPEVPAPRSRVEGNLENMEEVQKLLRKLPTREREVVRLFYLEGRSYEEISTALHIPVNTIGPVLARAKKKLREGTAPPTAVKAEPAKKPEEKAG
jgi:RNA polymerase sigma-70 factor (ECF subfamily)